MSTLVKPILLTCGDPAGVGLEVAVSAWKALKDEIPICLITDPRFLPADIKVKILDEPPSSLEISKVALPVVKQDFVGFQEPGKPNINHAPQVIKAIQRAVEFAKSGKCSAICTMPISKSTLKDGANFSFPGHTEYLAYLDESRNFAMMLVNK